jgi:hypothetical protein
MGSRGRLHPPIWEANTGKHSRAKQKIPLAGASVSRNGWGCSRVRSISKVRERSLRGSNRQCGTPPRFIQPAVLKSHFCDRAQSESSCRRAARKLPHLSTRTGRTCAAPGPNRGRAGRGRGPTQFDHTNRRRMMRPRLHRGPSMTFQKQRVLF